MDQFVSVWSCPLHEIELNSIGIWKKRAKNGKYITEMPAPVFIKMFKVYLKPGQKCFMEAEVRMFQ